MEPWGADFAQGLLFGHHVICCYSSWGINKVASCLEYPKFASQARTSQLLLAFPQAVYLVLILHDSKHGAGETG